MNKQYKYPETQVAELNVEQWLFEAKLNYLVSEIMATLDIDDVDEIAGSLGRAFQACGTLQLSLSRNFKKVYRFDGDNIILDWKISPLAFYLVVINCNPAYERVARAQLYFAMNQVSHK
jgi:hypothetical protein